MIDTLSDEPGRIAAVRRLDIFDKPHDRTFEHITELAKRALDVPMAAVSLIDEDRHLWRSAHGIEGAEMPRSASFCTYTVQKRHPLIVEDATADPRFMANPFVCSDPGLRSYIGAPLTMPDGYQIGALCSADVRPRSFSETDIALLTRLADVVVHEIELRQRAAVDPLTGVKQRRAFLETLNAVFEECSARRSPAVLAVVDLDHFKRVNDTYGHPAGDRVLTAAAQACLHHLGIDATVGRLGGEEFGIVFPAAKLDVAVAALERVRGGIAALRFDGLDALRVTASFGACELQDAIPNESVWFKLADAALYAAKHSGRDRIVVSQGILGEDSAAPAGTLPFLKKDPAKLALDDITRELLSPRAA